MAEGLKELTTQVVKTVDNAKKRISDMPHAKKKLNPLWGLLTEPLFQIIAAVGLLLSGVLGKSSVARVPGEYVLILFQDSSASFSMPSAWVAW